VAAAGSELEVRIGSGHREEHAVVAVVIAEAADLDQPEAVAVERNDLGQALRVPGDAQLRRQGRARRIIVSRALQGQREPGPISQRNAVDVALSG